MINFTDKEILDGWGIDIKFVETELSRIFPKNSVGDLVTSLRDVANKIVDDYIATGELDQYIQKYGTGFVDKLKTTAERDIGVVLISAMNDWQYAKTNDWGRHLSLYTTRTIKNYDEWIEKKEKWGTSSTSVHIPTKKYAPELEMICAIIKDGFPQSAKEDAKSFAGTMRILTEFISDEIRTKEDLLQEEVLQEAKRALTDKTPTLRLERYFDSDKDKISEFNKLIDKFIEDIMKRVKPTLFANMSQEEKLTAMQDLRRHLVDEVCNALIKSENSLYNETWLHDIASKKCDVDINFSSIRGMVYQLAENIANITIVPQINEKHRAKLEYLSEEGYDIKPEDECQWETFEYMSHNAYASVSNIATAIENAIAEGLSDIIHYISTKTLLVGDAVLEDNESVGQKPKGPLGRFVDDKNSLKPEQIDLPNKDTKVSQQEEVL